MAPLLSTVAALTAVVAVAPGALAHWHLTLPPAIPQGVTVLQTDLYCTKYGTVSQQVVPGATDVAQGFYCLPGVPSELLHYTDNTGNNRTACFYPNPSATAAKPLPLLTWLHPSLTPAALSLYVTGLLQAMYSTNLNNQDSSAIGFHILTPGGLYGTHEYPSTDRVGLGWDNWYRNFNRSDPTLNADVETIDYFIKTVTATGLADPRRLFMSGWSNGATMAEEYAMTTRGIAAAAVYSAPDPWRDASDRCAQIPLPTFATPTLDVHNQCDLIGICTTGKYFRDDLTYRYPSKPTNITVISSSRDAPVVLGSDAAAKCDPNCTPFGCVANATALAVANNAHTRWPATLNSVFFEYLLNHPLPASGSWPRLNADGVIAKAYPNIVTGTF